MTIKRCGFFVLCFLIFMRAAHATLQIFPNRFNGNLNTGLKMQGSDLIVGLNAYTKK